MVQFSLIKSVQIKSSEIRIKNSELTVDFDSTHDSGRPSDAPAHLSALNTFDSRLYLPTPPLPNQPHQRTSGPARAHWQMAAVAGLNCPNRSTTQNYKKFTQKLQTLNLKLYYRPPSFSNVCLFDENYYSELSKNLWR